MQLIRKEFVFKATPSIPSCHASTVLMTQKGELMCAYFAGTRDKDNDVRIWYTVRKNGVWSLPTQIPSDVEIPHWNPVLYEASNGTICLFYKIGYEISDWKTMLVTFDENLHPSTPRELIAGDSSGGRGPVKNKPIALSNGTLLAPASTETGEWLPFVDRWENGTWQKCAIPTEKGVGLIQPSLWESSPGCVHALMRSDCGKIYRSDSVDFGKTWSRAYPTDMPNNNSGLDCVRTDDGTLILVCNPNDTNWGKRTPLTVFVSHDNGVGFCEALCLENDEGEYSYPAVIFVGKRLYISYTWNRTAIVCCEIDP